MKTKLLQPHTSFSTQGCRFGAPPSESSLNRRRGGWCRIAPGTRPFSSIPPSAPPAAANRLLLKLTGGFLFFSYSFLTRKASRLGSVLLCVFHCIWIQSDQQLFTSSPSPHPALVLYKNTQKHLKKKQTKNTTKKNIKKSKLGALLVCLNSGLPTDLEESLCKTLKWHVSIKLILYSS